MANLGMATDENSTARNSGARIDKTEWHRVVTLSSPA